MRKQKIDQMIDKIPGLRIFLQKLRLRDTRQKYQTNRTIFINNNLPDNYSGERPFKYASNRVCTSKYTLLNFLPKNLYEQFRRLANFYFLLNIIVMFILPDPPKNPYSSMIPLLMVITFTAMKQAYEDILRHRSDARINKKKVRVLRNGSLVNLKRKDIKCGDIVEVNCDQSFPCDLILFYSLGENGTCHVTTANLDGETNLKIRTIPKKFPSINQVEDMNSIKGIIKCDKPNEDLYEFKGKIEINGHEYPVNNDSVLLAGSTLKIAPVIYGCAIYTGKETKIMLNSKFRMSKLSCIEKTMNKFIIFFFILLVFYVVTCLVGLIVTGDLYKKHWYLNGREPKFFNNKFVYYSIEIVSQFSIFSYIIPISLYVSIETQRFIGTKFFEWDLNMYDEKTDQPARANNSNVNEDLGQIEYLFTDKTGTLTENEMIFKRFFVNNQTYDYKDGKLTKVGFQNTSVDPKNENLKFFLLCLSLCHTVQVDKNAVNEKFQASSPDEFSLVKFCEKIGVVYEGDVRNLSLIRMINYFGNVNKYELLHILEFDSIRKRMSVITKCLESDKIFIFTKGAEDSIFSICKIESGIDENQRAVDSFAQYGWRTLALAFKEITKDDYDFYESLLTEAFNDLSDKHKETMRIVYETIENDLYLIGCTAVEDRLQEGVSSTLVDLRKAGIKIWVLTGDKKQTAINISDSCKHFSQAMKKMFLTDLNDLNLIMRKLSEDYNKIKENKQKKSFAYIIDGKTLSYVFKFELEKKLRDVCEMCDAVLCCRMSPSQKAQVVKLIKESKKRPVTCAIGDGANDVSMIQEADVGIGIFGKEGRNAARSSDFAVSKFKHTKRALLVHGYLYYTRLCTLIMYFFYKNIVMINCQIFYAPISAFSVQSLYPLIYMAFYNVFFSAFPIAAYGLLEQKIKISQLEMNPTFYKTITRNKGLSLFQFIKWNVAGLWHSIVSYYSTYLLFTSEFISIESSGKICGEVEFGSIVFIQVLIIVHIKLFLVWKSINLIAIFSYFLSVMSFLIWCFTLNAFIMPFPLTTLTEEQGFFWTVFSILSYPSVWLCFLVSSSIAMIPDLIVHLFEDVYQDYKLKMIEKKAKLLKKNYADNLPRKLSEQNKKREKLKRKKSINWKIPNDKVINENNFVDLHKVQDENNSKYLFKIEKDNSNNCIYQEYSF